MYEQNNSRSLGKRTAASGASSGAGPPSKCSSSFKSKTQKYNSLQLESDFVEIRPKLDQAAR